MGSVPNAVFERLMESVAAGQSAELMDQLNLLVNAGHSPSSLARQMVRYLRNALMAKLGGEQTELLQISGDERARAARTALLFSEEELTRNLQIVLRTFDDLNYRQEQRFHLELGLIKLIHAQRLLPIEELLSGMASGAGPVAGPRIASASAAPRTGATHAVTNTTAPARTAPAVAPAAPSVSPFGSTDSSWGSTHEPVVQKKSPAESAVADSPPTGPSNGAKVPVSSISAPAASMAAASSVATLIEEPTPPAQVAGMQAGAPSLDAIRHAIGTALVGSGHVSAAQLLGTANWTLDSASLRIEVPGLGKKMLALTINAAAEKIIRQELQRLGAPARFLVVPGDGPVSTSATDVAPIAGSIQEAALNNPLVQRAKEIFNAEVRSVVDLRQK
jgi:DNA polymerase-3 subunit gamma/tau